jgi:hypothetical protein
VYLRKDGSRSARDDTGCHSDFFADYNNPAFVAGRPSDEKVGEHPILLL